MLTLLSRTCKICVPRAPWYEERSDKRLTITTRNETWTILQVLSYGSRHFLFVRSLTHIVRSYALWTINRPWTVWVYLFARLITAGRIILPYGLFIDTKIFLGDYSLHLTENKGEAGFLVGGNITYPKTYCVWQSWLTKMQRVCIVVKIGHTNFEIASWVTQFTSPEKPYCIS